MFGIIPLYFVGKYFSRLAEQHKRSRFGFGALGIGVFLFSQLLFFFAMLIFTDNAMSDGDFMVLNIGTIVTGLGSTIFLYHYLKKKWANGKPAEKNPELLDDL